jgi:uncharacterized membrane protein HdeD (DUF308 family)
MDPHEAERGEGHHIAGFFQSHWLLFILLGGLLIAAGGVAIVVPAISSIAANEVLGLVLIFVGIVQIAQSGKMKGEAQFAWHLTLGLLAAVGGVFVYLDPFESVVTLTILMAIVFALHGLTQIAFALRVRRLRGSSWFLISGWRRFPAVRRLGLRRHGAGLAAISVTFMQQLSVALLK